MSTRNQNTNMKHSGFTLIELMISVIVSSIVLVGVGFFVSGIGSTTAQMYGQQIESDRISVSLSMLKQDIEKAGVGIPLDIFVLSSIDMNELDDQIRLIARNTIGDVDGTINGTGLGFPGSDTLILGGVSMLPMASSHKSMQYLSDAASAFGNNYFLGARVDMPDAGINYSIWGLSAAEYHALDPVGEIMMGQPGIFTPEYMSIVSFGQGWRFQNPSMMFVVGPGQVGPAAAVQSGVVGIEIDPVDASFPNLIATPQEGDVLLFNQAFMATDGTILEPGNMQLAGWFVANDSNGVPTLYRTMIMDPTDPNFLDHMDYTTIPVLPNVVDMQVDFLIYPCGGANPIRVDNLIHNPDILGVAPTWAGEFANTANYNVFPAAGAPPVTNLQRIANAFMALRERLISVQVSLVTRRHDPEGASTQPIAPRNSSKYISFMHQNNPLNLDASEYVYELHELTFDPVNVRIKSLVTDSEFYPPVRDVQTDQRTQQGGVCTGKAS